MSNTGVIPHRPSHCGHCGSSPLLLPLPEPVIVRHELGVTHGSNSHVLREASIGNGGQMSLDAPGEGGFESRHSERQAWMQEGKGRGRQDPTIPIGRPLLLPPSAHLIVDEAICNGAHSVGIDGIDARKELGLGEAAAVDEKLAANGLGDIWDDGRGGGRGVRGGVWGIG